MKLLILILLLLCIPTTTVNAAEFDPPEPPAYAEDLMPDSQESFEDGLLEVISSALPAIQPSLAAASRECCSVLAVILLVTLTKALPYHQNNISSVVGSIAIGALLLRSSDTLIRLGAETVRLLNDYGKLLIPVMTAALAAQGYMGSSSALYAGTVLFNTLLSTAITKLVLPLIYIFLCLCVVSSAIGEDILQKMCDLVKWLMTWTLKTILYVFTGYISLTGIITKTMDAAAVKAAKLAISGAVPVVGSILSDASETLLASVAVMKNSAGIYGTFAIICILIEPFMKIAVQYLLLKFTAAVSSIFGSKQEVALVQNFSSAMGILLGMTGTVSVLLLISTICFIGGAG